VQYLAADQCRRAMSSTPRGDKDRSEQPEFEVTSAVDAAGTEEGAAGIAD
jgi:hypothetical protein